MARIVYITNGMASTLNSSLELSRRLTDAGHEVSYVSHVDLRECVRAHGFEFQQIVECQAIAKQFTQRLNELKKTRSIFTHWIVAKLGGRARRRSANLTEIRQYMEKVKPDLLLIDFEMHYAIFATYQLKIPTVLTSVWFTIFRSTGLPPMHTELPTAGDLVGRMKISLAWWKLILSRFLEPIRGLSPRGLKKRLYPIAYGTNSRADLQAVAKAHNAPFSRMTSRTNWSKPHTYRELPLMIFNAKEMELEHPKHLLEHYVGPMVCNERVDTEIAEGDLTQWDSFVEARASGKQKLIYCSLGTFWSTDLLFLNKVIETFRNRPDWALVLGLGGKSTKSDFAQPPANVLIMDHAPQLAILKESDAAISHGGITTINECITYGVPMLVCSTGHVDQPGCAVRVQHHRLGRLLNIQSATSSEIERELDALLADRDIRTHVEAMREIFEQYSTQGTAVKLVESLIRNGLQSQPETS